MNEISRVNLVLDFSGPIISMSRDCDTIKFMLHKIYEKLDKDYVRKGLNSLNF